MREVLDRRRTPAGEIQLQRRGNHLEIIFNGVFIMASYNGRSEAAMVSEAVRLLGRPPERVVVAGLGMGFTLAEVLSTPGVKRVVLYEVESAVVEWNRGPLAHLNGNSLSDPRVQLVVDDFAGIPGLPKCDMMCVDLDNGPDMPTLPGNSGLYREYSLTRLRDSLETPGVLAFWCPQPHPGFEKALKSVFDEVHGITVGDLVYCAVAR